MIGILSFLSGVVSFGLKIWSFFTTRTAQKQGADAQSARDTATAEAADDRMAQAEADAPKTKADALKRLEDGSA